MSTYHYHFKTIVYDKEKKVTEEWDVPSDDANPEPMEKTALEMWTSQHLSEIEVTGPFHYSTDRWRFHIKREAGPVKIKWERESNVH